MGSFESRKLDFKEKPMSIIVNTIFTECTKHFANPDSRFYSYLHKTSLGGGFVIIQKAEWQSQPDPAAQKALILSRLENLEALILKKAKQ